MTKNTSRNRIPIGTNRANGKLVYVNADEFKDKHAHILGVTGMGKTYFLDYLIRTFLARGWGVCLIDPMGGLYKRMLKFAVRRRLEDRTILIDPNDQEWAVGLNLLEFDPNSSSVSAHVEDVMREITLVLGEARGDFMPVVDRWVRNALTLLTEAKLSTYEMMDIAHPDPETAFVRRRILRERQLDVRVREEWSEFDTVLSRQDRSFINTIIKGRGVPFSTPHARRIFGQNKTTIDFARAMDEGKLVLVNLKTEAISESERRMLGVDVIYKLKHAAMSRKRIDRPFFVFIDEFGSLVNQQIIEALDTLRQRGVNFYLSHQRLEQLRDFSENLRSAVLESTRLKFIFRVNSPQDRQELAEMLFAGQIRGDKVKLTRRAFAPRTEWVDIRTTTTSHAAGGSEGTADGAGRGGNTGANQTQILRDGEGLFAVPVQVGATAGQTDTQNWQEHHSHSASSLWTDSSGESITRAPMTIHEEYEEISQFYSLEEAKQEFADRLLQDVRAMHFKDDTHKPIPLITPEVEDPPVRKVDVDEFKKTVYPQYALPSAEAAKQIETRREQLMAVGEDDPAAWAESEVVEGEPQSKPKKARIRVPVVEQNPHE